MISQKSRFLPFWEKGFSEIGWEETRKAGKKTGKSQSKIKQNIYRSLRSVFQKEEKAELISLPSAGK